MKNLCTTFVALFALVFVYAQNPVKIIHHLWESEEWMLIGEVDLSYNDGDQILQQTLFGMDYNTSELVKAYEEIYIYDESDLLIEKSSRIKSDFDDTWSDYHRYTYEYDANHRLITETFEEYTMDFEGEWVWQPFNRKIYEYDSLNLKTRETLQNWFFYSLWVNAELTIYSYDEEHRLSSAFIKAMSEEDTTTTDLYLIEYSYADNGVLESTEKIKSDSGVWTPYEKEDYFHNEQDQLTQTVQSVWNNEEEEYTSVSRDSYTYNDQNLLSVKTTENYLAGNWVNYRRYQYMYPTPTLLKSQKSVVSIYPNPGSSIINVRFENASERRVDVVDISGRTVFSVKTQAEYLQIPVNLLPAQMYFVRIQEQNETQTLRFIKH